METKRYAVIVAGGSGQRMGADMPKQFLLLREKPILMHTIEKFEGCEIVLVLPETQIEYWRGLVKAYDFRIPHQVVVGGDTRSESVQNGLAKVPADALVAIHDGVRPLVTKALIYSTFDAAEEFGSGVPAIECTDSVREWKEDEWHAADRACYRLVQTPQTFPAYAIQNAYRKVNNAIQTDDATIYEMAGGEVHLVQGLRSNIKITLPADIKIAEALM